MTIFSDQENNSTQVGSSIISRDAGGAKASNANLGGLGIGVQPGGVSHHRIYEVNGRQHRIFEDDGSQNNMEYAWLEPRHDPIATDTNLAEIDFEDFRNEDLAYAFSCGVSLDH